MGGLEPTHWIVVLVAAAALFGGYKKLPEMARSAGRSMRIFKTELKGMADDDEARSAAKGETPTPAVPVTQPAQTVTPVAVAPAQPVASAPVFAPPVAGSSVAAPAVAGPMPTYTAVTDPTAPPSV